MSTVNFTLRNKIYTIACDNGEEERITQLAASLNVRVNAMSQSFGTASDNIILAFTALMMEDEILSMKNGTITNNSNALLEQVYKDDQQDIINNAIADAIEPIAQYVEDLANLIEKV